METIVTLALVSVVGLVAAPSFVELTDSFDRVNSRSYVMQDLKRAQAESITEGCRGIINIAADGRSYTFGCDYLSYDTSTDPSSDSVSFRRALPGTVTITADAPLVFNSRGQAVDIDGIVTNITIALHQGTSSFSTGTILGTGVFTYQ